MDLYSLTIIRLLTLNHLTTIDYQIKVKIFNINHGYIISIHSRVHMYLKTFKTNITPHWSKFCVAYNLVFTIDTQKQTKTLSRKKFCQQQQVVIRETIHSSNIA